MRAFDSIAKKLAIPMVVLFEIGWVMFTGGFGSIRREYGSINAAPNVDEVLRTPVLFPYYFVLVGGQFVALFLFLHASLPSSIASYIVGVLSSILNVIYFVSVGFLIQWSVSRVKYYEEFVSSFQPSPYSLYSSSGLELERAIFAGTILMTVSWGLIQLLLFFYEPQIDSRNQRSLWHVIREFATDIPSSTSQLKTKFGEVFRICTIPFLIISVIGWCVCVAGLYKLSDAAATYLHTITNYSRYNYDFGTWATFFVTPLLFLAALLHAGCSGGASTMSGVFAAILNTFFVLSMGSTVVDVCITKYLFLQDQSTFSFTEEILQVIHNGNLILGGGVVCLFFWTIVHAAWHFYHCKGSTDHTKLQLNQEDDHAQFVSHVQQDEYGFSPEQLPPSTKHLEAEL